MSNPEIWLSFLGLSRRDGYGEGRRTWGEREARGRANDGILGSDG